jgi:hypothetical protein
VAETSFSFYPKVFLPLKILIADVKCHASPVLRESSTD